jgi:RNA 2',3'-cyclic 3'-phosphodiesterase
LGEGQRERTRRLFFALWPDEAMQSALAEAARAVVSTCDGTPVPTRNFHFTLAFLGSVPESRIADLTPIAARVALAFQDVSTAPISITLDRIELWRKSQVLCATSRAQPSHAIALAETLKRTLTEHGFAPDLKPFRAHATLVRKVRRVTRERDMPTVSWSFREFRLVESQTAPSGSLYSAREIYALDGGHPLSSTA